MLVERDPVLLLQLLKLSNAAVAFLRCQLNVTQPERIIAVPLEIIGTRPIDGGEVSCLGGCTTAPGPPDITGKR